MSTYILIILILCTELIIVNFLIYVGNASHNFDFLTNGAFSTVFYRQIKKTLENSLNTFFLYHAHRQSKVIIIIILDILQVPPTVR